MSNVQSPDCEKAELRVAMKAVLRGLSEEWLQQAGGQIRTSIVSFFRSLPEVKHILAFTAAFPGEIDLGPLIDALAAEVAIYLPLISGPGAMEFIRVTGDWRNALEQGPYGILQPGEIAHSQRYRPEYTEAKTLVLVPGLAFDRDGRRLGRGGGYYDRFLEGLSSDNTIPAGVCCSMQLVSQVPDGLLDHPMRYIITEQESFETGRRS